MENELRGDDAQWLLEQAENLARYEEDAQRMRRIARALSRSSSQEPMRGELAAIEGNQIVVRVPIEAIPHAACDALEQYNVEVTDTHAAAKALVRYLNKEDEVGNTLVHFALDKALANAVDQGEEGFETVAVQPEGQRG